MYFIQITTPSQFQNYNNSFIIKWKRWEVGGWHLPHTCRQPPWQASWPCYMRMTHDTDTYTLRITHDIMTYHTRADSLHKPDGHVAGEWHYIPPPPPPQLVLVIARSREFVKLAINKDPNVAEGNNEDVAAVDGPKHPPKVFFSKIRILISFILGRVRGSEIGNGSRVDVLIEVFKIKTVDLFPSHTVGVSFGWVWISHEESDVDQATS